MERDPLKIDLQYIYLIGLLAKALHLQSIENLQVFANDYAFHGHLIYQQ